MSVVVIRSLIDPAEDVKLTKVFIDARQAAKVAEQWSKEGYRVEVIDLRSRSSKTLTAAQRDPNFPDRPGLDHSKN
jgi:hypothetical protein